MKTLVIYYSKTGNTKAVAQTIAEAVVADMEEITEPKAKRDGLLGFLRSGRDGMMQRKSVIAPPRARIEDYDMVIVGSPVWGWNLVPSIRTYLSSINLAGKKAALFCTMGSSGDAKTFESMTSLMHGAQILGTLAMKQEEVADSVTLRQRVTAWIESLGLSQD
jgi:flavodoxin